MELKLLTPYLSKPKNTNEVMEISDESIIFYLKEFTAKMSRENIRFLKELYAHSIPEYRINKTSALYFFKAGDAIIELDIVISKDIHIKPYFHYNPQTVKKDIYKITELDYLLYSVLKINEMQ